MEVKSKRISVEHQGSVDPPARPISHIQKEYRDLTKQCHGRTNQGPGINELPQQDRPFFQFKN